MAIKKSHLTTLGVRDSDAEKYLADLNQLMQQYQIDTDLRIAHFLAQVLHESAHMKTVQENLNYSEQALLRVFRKYFTPSQARSYARKPKMIASRVYGGRMGNGDESTGDGWRYRGRGLIQLTGKSNYSKFSDWIGDDVVGHPDLVAKAYAVHSAVYYWTSRDLNRYADQDDVKKITRIINGGLNGLANRNAILDKAKQMLEAEFAPELLEQATHSVIASSLNLRSRPKVSPSTKICALPQGTQIAVIERTQPGWARVRAVLNGHIAEGFVASKYLRPLPKPAKPVAVTLDHPSHVVNASKLNFRSQPTISSSTKIASLNLGTKVEKIADAFGGWLKIRVVLNRKTKEGYVAGKYLQPLSETPTESILVPQETSIDFEILPVHLAENRTNITRRRDGGRAFPLGEANRPKRSEEDTKNRMKSVLKIIKYLNSEYTQHKRYQPKQRTTYCNIYACDFCYLAGAYLPRVWWNDKALLQIKDDVAVPVQYAKTVREMNANMLLDWFEDYGALFGWKRVFDLDVLQAASNNGEVCIIVAQRHNLNHSGHITVVAPEHDGFAATRNSAGEVQRPVESQAGRKNHRFYVNTRRWWLGSNFRNHGFWRHV
ncbi:MAG: SH3 domain-containing protein [Desulfobacterales bacterium]|jgi:predicted chitinase